MREVTSTHKLHRIMIIITTYTSHHLAHYIPRPFLHFHDVQHIAHHRLRSFGLAQFPIEIDYIGLPLIRTALPPNMQRGILNGQRPNRHGPKAIFLTITQNDIDGYTTRMSRSALSLHPIVHNCKIFIRWNFVDTSYLHSIFRL